jgi:peptidoglycan hydrolase-like protein with peptidoglycan-binding domain
VGFHSHQAKASSPTTWYIRPDGGTRYGNNTPYGGCNGEANAPYPGLTNVIYLATTPYTLAEVILDDQGHYETVTVAGTSDSTLYPAWGVTTQVGSVTFAQGGLYPVNQSCAYDDFRYLYDDQRYNPLSVGWVISGGDTVIVEGCWNVDENSDGQTYCRTGSSPPGRPDVWCVGNAGGTEGCTNPAIPSGTAGDPTQILGANYASCATGNAVNPANYASRLTQIFGGNGESGVLALSSSYVNLECLNITAHAECVQHGTPAYPHACGTSDDYATQGIFTGNTISNTLFQDVWIHGLTAAGINGPIGANINLTRVNISFNGFAGWNFQDEPGDDNGPNASINASHVFMEGNGCNEEYPIVHTAFPAVSCYDLSSGGFGDAWSGQTVSGPSGDSHLLSFICNDCEQWYNTKDGFIGPHTEITNLKITNSISYGNMGQQWKWGQAGNSTLVFDNNLAIGNCDRMAYTLPGAPYNYNQNTSNYGGAHLSLFCRAAGDNFSIYSGANATMQVDNNTVIGYNPVIFDINCYSAGTCMGTTWNFNNNIFLGVMNNDPLYSNSGHPPTLYYDSDPDNSVTVAGSYNVEYGVQDGTCPGGTGMVCSSPLLVIQPPSAITSELQLNNFNFNPSATSPAIAAGIAIPGLTTDYNGTTRGNPPTIGAIEVAGSGNAPPPSTPSVPTNLSVSSVTTSTISLSWSASTESRGTIDGYDIYRNGSEIGTSNTTSYTEAGLSPSTNYSYTVASYDASGNISAQSGSVSGITSAAPTGGSGGTTPTSTPTSTPNPTGPSGYTFCANENGTCSFSGTMSVAFGAGTSFNYLTLTNGTPCTDAVFTDPDVGVVKACFTKSVADTTPPTTSITSPTNNATESGTITISASASDNVGVTSVALYVDGSLQGTDTTSPYTFASNTNSLSNGTHTLSTKAYDAAGNVGTSGNVTITVSNASGTPAPVVPPVTSGGGGGVVIPPTPSFSITSVNVSNIAPTTAAITVTTHVPASIEIKYGLTTIYGMTTTLSPSLETNTISLTRLSPNTVYDFVVAAALPGGSPSITSANYTFTTAATPGEASTTQAFTKPLSLGSSRAEVTLLQTILHAQGFLPASIAITDYFGTRTQHALLLFQTAHDLPLTGYVDLQTEASLNKIVAAEGTTETTALPATTTLVSIPAVSSSAGVLTENLAPGSTGSQVTVLQHLLNTDGDYPTAIYTQYYGSLTEAAVKTFQTKQGIVNYGTPATTGYGAVGPKTRGKLEE